MYGMSVDFSHRDSTMPAIKYKVNLSDDEKLQLEALLRKGKSEVEANVKERNLKATPVNWRFTTQDARRKLFRLYPCVSK